MPHLVIKIAKIIVLGLLPLFLISSTGMEKSLASVSNNGTYMFETSGTLNQPLKGDITFETSMETSVNGLSFSTLKLNFDNNLGDVPHTMEFLISKENDSNGIAKGTYAVHNIEGFLNHFDGVFGVADIGVLGEAPFFATRGIIRIIDLKDNSVKGKLNISLSNENGNAIRILGDFEAK